MKKTFIGLIALVTGLVLAVPAQAATNFTDPIPYTGTSQDSSTCGGNWAVDVYTRNFSAVGSGSVFTVTEKYKNGHFSTIAGLSAGSCDTNAGGTIREGVQGTFSGQLKFIVTNATFNAGGSCVRDISDGLCHTDGWVAGFFGAGAVIGDTQPNWSFKYKAKGSGLIFNSWINADPAVGGNVGDISSP